MPFDRESLDIDIEDDGTDKIGEIDWGDVMEKVDEKIEDLDVQAAIEALEGLESDVQQRIRAMRDDLAAGRC